MGDFLDLLYKYLQIFVGGFTGAAYDIYRQVIAPFTGEVSDPWYKFSFFYWVVIASLLVWVLELVWPWRKKQKPFRKDFWLDLFYIFFNIYLFRLIGYNAVSNVFVEAFNNFLEHTFGVTNLVAISIAQLHVAWQMVIFVVVADFINFNIHRLLHRVPFLWNYHKLHHSSEEMGFAVQMRYHWGEGVVYNVLKYIPLGMIGVGFQDYITISVISFTWGHINHANIPLKLGPLKYILNNPRMHIWHHAKHLPEDRKYGVNFGLTLSIWDYIFRTNYIPKDGKDIELGFPHSEQFPQTFWEQMKYPFKKDKPDETVE